MEKIYSEGYRIRKSRLFMVHGHVGLHDKMNDLELDTPEICMGPFILINRIYRITLNLHCERIYFTFVYKIDNGYWKFPDLFILMNTRHFRCIRLERQS